MRPVLVVGWFVLLTLLLASCGEEPHRSSAVPGWADVAHEQIAAANRIGLPLAAEVLQYRRRVGTGRGPADPSSAVVLDLLIQPDGVAELEVEVEWPRTDGTTATGTWRYVDGALRLDMSKSKGGSFVAFITPPRGGTGDVELHAGRDFHRAFRRGASSAGSDRPGCEESFTLVLLSPSQGPVEGAR